MSNTNESPLFDAGAFTISHLSDSPEGFEFATRRVLGRTNSTAARPPEFNDPEQRARLRAAMRREMQFNDTEALASVRAELEKAITADVMSTDELDELRRRYEEAQSRGKKIGIRAVELVGDTLTADVQLVSFPMYNLFANPGSSPELQTLSSATGVAMVLRTKDNRLVIQHRASAGMNIETATMTPGNASYPDVPGMSVAGMVDASLSYATDRKAGTPDPVDTDYIRGSILKEAGEELGLGPEEIRLRIVGLAQDKVKIHDEVLFLGELSLTANELREASRLSARNKNLRDADFEEKFIDIECSTDAIETLLTDVKCPIPSTHAAVLIAAGYALCLEQGSKASADAWRERLETSVRENYTQMDARVAEYHTKYPEVLDQVPERFWGKPAPVRNRTAYVPGYTPQEQGLPSFEDEMIRTGLLPETRQHVDHAHLFDVDGVITNPQEKRVTDEKMLNEIIDLLRRSEPVCFNTGRSTSWVMERVVGPMRERLGEDRALLQNVIIVGEKGGTWTIFDKLGVETHNKVETITVPDELKDDVRALIAEKYSDVMFFDESKETMVSVEMQDGYDIGQFSERQKEFVKDMEAILQQRDMADTYRIDPTTIATDIESPYAGKALGADRFMEFLKLKEIVAHEFTAFGDSGSDVAMADELARRGLEVDFVYVGSDPDSLDLRANYPVSSIGGYDYTGPPILHTQ